MLPNGVSIVICTFNGVARLQPTLEAIFALKMDNNIPFELIVIDNASTDNTSQFCLKLITNSGFENKSRIIYEGNPGCNHARLRGLYEAKYQWLLFCDDDNHLFPDYLQNAWKLLYNNPSIGVLGGEGIAKFESSKPDWFDKYSKSFAIGAQNSVEGKLNSQGRKLYSAGSFFRKEALMYYYNQNFTTIMTGPKGNELTRGEDTEWCMMIELIGFELWYNSSLKFYHYMTEGRMKWEYYLKLKEGIASGSAKFESYTPFLKKTLPSGWLFLSGYFRNALFHCLNWIQFSVRSKLFPSRYLKDELQIGLVVNKKKAIAYMSDFKESFNHFKQVKQILSRK